MAKILIMLVRVLGVAAIIVGGLLWSGRESLLGPHIGLGFLVAAVLFTLSVIALMRKAVVPGILGVVAAVALPIAGFMQFPITKGEVRPVQIAHFFVALFAIGLAERLYSAARKA